MQQRVGRPGGSRPLAEERASRPAAALPAVARLAAVATLLLLCGTAAARRNPSGGPVIPASTVTGDVAAVEAVLTAAATSTTTGNITIGSGANVTSCGPIWIRLAGPANGSVCYNAASASGSFFGSCSVVGAVCAVSLGPDGVRYISFWPCPGGRIVVRASFAAQGEINYGPSVTASAWVDCFPPKMLGMKLTASTTAPPTSSSISLVWSGSPEDWGMAGLAGYALAYRLGKTSPPLFCDAGTAKQNVTVITGIPLSGVGTEGSPYVVPALAPGTKYSFRLCAYDAADNYAGGITRTVSTAP